jgi:signal transduction histidine kinase
VIRPRFTVRVRLTLLYTALFVACGAIVVAITYGLLAGSLQKPTGKSTVVQVPDGFVQQCKEALNDKTSDPSLRQKCEVAFQEGVDAGAQAQRDAVLATLLRNSIATLAGVTLLAAVAGWFVAGRVLRPIHRITDAARAASEHNLTARVSLTGPRDELRQLADTFDAMLDRLETAFQGQQRFIANASHELRTPLTVMRATIDVVLAKPAPSTEELVRMGQDVRAAVDHAEVLIEALLTLARNERGLAVHEPTDLATVIEDVVDELEPGDRHTHLDLEPAPVLGDPILLERLAANLVDNAVRYNVSGGQIWVATSTVDGHRLLQVANTGPVVPADAVARLFQPFQRLHDRTGDGGFGLGLAIVASIAGVHGGVVTAEPLDGGGLVVTVRLPAQVATTRDRNVLR